MRTLLGLALIVLAMRDVRHELFHPEQSGTLSRLLSRVIWRASRSIATRYRPWLYRAGPIMLMAIGAMWVALVVLGATLINLDHLPRDFNVNPGLPPEARRGFVTALYISASQITSAGAADITPVSVPMRLLAAFEPLTGLVVITAWITWVLSIYPIIAQRRAFAREVDLLRRAQPDADTVAREGPSESVGEILHDLTSQVVIVAAQLSQARITYYFQNEDPEHGLASTLPYVLALARSAEREGREPAIRQLATRLRMAVEDLLCDIGDAHLGVTASPDKVLDALARDHLRNPKAQIPKPKSQ